MAKKIVTDENWSIDYFNFLSVYCCPSVFAIFKMKKNLSYKQSFEMFLKMINLPLSKKEVEWTARMSVYAHDLAVFRQNVCLLENMMKKSLIDLNSEEFKTNLAEIRKDVLVEGGETLTNYNFIKLIRNTFAHNNELEETPRLTFFEDLKEGAIKFKVEKPDEGIKIVMGPKDMETLCNTLVGNVTTDCIPEGTLAIRTNRLKNAVVGKYFDAKKINRYMQDVKTDEEFFDLQLDEIQEEAITNYLSSGIVVDNEPCLMRKCKGKAQKTPVVNPSLINTIFPRTRNAVSLALQNLINLNSIYREIRENPNVTMDDISEKMYEYAQSKDMTERDFGITANYFLGSSYSLFLETSNALTTVLANRDVVDLEEEYKSVFDEGTLRHIRNAMVHGTYFYDFKGKVHIYDGQKKLKHITSFDGMEILAKTQQLAGARWRETFKVKVQDYNSETDNPVSE